MSEGTPEGQPYQPPPQQPGYQPPPQQPGFQQPPAQQPGFQPPPQQPGYQQPPQQAQHQSYAQQPYYQPAPGSGPPPVKKKSRVWLILLILIGIPILLIGGCSAAVFWASRVPVGVTNDFLADVQAGDYNAAFDHTKPSCGIAANADELAQIFSGVSVTSYNISGISSNNGVTSTNGTITFDGSDVRAIEVGLSDDLVCTIDIDGP